MRLRATTEYDDETGEPLYWLHDFGWVRKPQSTVYDMSDMPEPAYAVQGSEFVEDTE